MHVAEFNRLTGPNELFWDEALGKIKQIDRSLAFELGMLTNMRELVITSQGHADAFPLVEALVAQAPPALNWKFTALKPPMGFAFTTTYEGIRFDPRQMWFLPLKSASRPTQLGLRVCIPDFSPAIKREAKNAIAIILATALGEREAAMIDHTEVANLPSSPGVAGYTRLDELPRYIEWYMGRHRRH